jgi:hypothetical protein
VLQSISWSSYSPSVYAAVVFVVEDGEWKSVSRQGPEAARTAREAERAPLDARGASAARVGWG